MGNSIQKRGRAKVLGSPRRLMIGLVVGAVAVGGMAGSGPLDAGNSSLPLAGNEFPSGAGAPVDQVVTGTASHWNVFNWAPGELGAVASSYSMNTVDSAGRTVKRVLVATGSNPDVGTAASVNNMSTSEDSGKTFLTTDRNSAASALNMTRLADGSLLSIDFIPEWGDAAHSFTNLKVRTSKDGGKSWKVRNAPVSTPADKKLGPMSNGLRVHRRIITLADGTLMVPIYTVFQGSSKQVSAVLQSTDAGLTWSLRSVIPAAAQPGTNEVGWSYTADGRLTAVMRTTHSPEAHLVQSFSDDDGQTWSEATDLLGPDGVVVHGIFPDLLLQPNGTLLLTTGRPDVRLLVSNDGNGKTWQTQTTVFANYPSTGNNGRYDGTSGNNTMENVGANTSVLFYDQCHVWGCGAYDQQFGVSAEYVSAITPGAGRIDVASKLIDGTATVTGDFAKATKKFPEQRPQGAFDGSSAANAEAVLTAKKKAPELLLTLDREYTLNRLGLMLGHGELAQTATVSLSTDGTHWTQVLSARNRLDRAMRYTDFTAQKARYVKVSGPGNTITTVTELELYAADIDTFENEIPFSVPRGWTDATHAWVTNLPNNIAYSDIGGYHSSTALRLWDKWTDDNARISRVTPATNHQVATMQWGSSDLRARFTFGALAADSGGTNIKAWDFRITPGVPATKPPTIEAFNGTSWTTIGTLSTVLPSRTYLPLTIDTTAAQATITLGPDSFTTSIKAASSGKQTGLHFSTSDPAEYGGIYYLDDVTVRG